MSVASANSSTYRWWHTPRAHARTRAPACPRRECEAYALQVGKLDFNTPQEKEAVEAVFSSAMQASAVGPRRALLPANCPF